MGYIITACPSISQGETYRGAETQRWSETLSISCAVSVLVECQGILFSLVSSTNHNLSQRSSSFVDPEDVSRATLLLFTL